MKRLALLLLALAVTVPCRAQSIQELFGVDPGPLLQEAYRQQAEYEARQARERAQRAKGDWLGELTGSVLVPQQDQACMLAAVAKRLGVSVPAGEPPAVYRASRGILEDYQSYYYSEFGTQSTPRAIATLYCPSNNAIFIDDSAKSYGPGRGIDDALAGQYALYLQYRALGRAPGSAQAQAAAAEVEAWFHFAYTANKASACR
ncbi:MAG: hypothetical protein NTY77_20010 [Elusimicrobia bacterium]|nr:hypothetical protein [Elusimicrobiota bacterium]